MGSTKEVELILEYVAESDMAIRFTDGTITEWLAKSQIEYFPDDEPDSMLVICPIWLAKSKGFI